MLRASHALSQLSLRTIICGTENLCPYLHRGERAGSESLIQSSRTGGDADEFQGPSRGRKEVGKDAGRRPGGSNWLPSSRDRLSRERMRLASTFLGKQNTQHRNPRLWRKPYPGYWGPHCLLGRGTRKRQEADFAAGWRLGACFWLPAPGSPSHSRYTKPSQAFPNGRRYLHFPGWEAPCRGAAGPFHPRASSTLGGRRVSQRWGRKRGPGLLLPSLSFISQAVLPLGAFWKGPCCGNEHLSRLWSLAFKGLSDFPPGFQTPTVPPASPSQVSMLPREPASHFQAGPAGIQDFPFLPIYFLSLYAS